MNAPTKSQNVSLRAHLVRALLVAFISLVAVLPGVISAPFPLWTKLSFLVASFGSVFLLTWNLTRPRVLVENTSS